MEEIKCIDKMEDDKFMLFGPKKRIECLRLTLTAIELWNDKNFIEKRIKEGDVFMQL